MLISEISEMSSTSTMETKRAVVASALRDIVALPLPGQADNLEAALALEKLMANIENGRALRNNMSPNNTVDDANTKKIYEK